MVKDVGYGLENGWWACFKLRGSLLCAADEACVIPTGSVFFRDDACGTFFDTHLKCTQS